MSCGCGCGGSGACGEAVLADAAQELEFTENNDLPDRIAQLELAVIALGSSQISSE